MKSWYEIYRERMNSKYLEHVAAKYAPFLSALYKAEGFQFTEIGCGAGNITRLLREMRDRKNASYFHLVDNCPKMLSLAIENNPTFNCTFSCKDVVLFEMDPTHVIHSHGLLEHFEDAQIRQLVKQCSWSAPLQIHYVPGAKYETPSRGDERLLHPDQWKKILKGIGRTEISTFNDDFDIIIRVER